MQNESQQKKSTSVISFDWRKYLEESPPMLIQGVQCNEFDAEFHVVLFNIESLIG